MSCLTKVMYVRTPEGSKRKQNKRKTAAQKTESMIWRRKTMKKAINRLFAAIWFREQTMLRNSDNVSFRVQADIGMQTHIDKEQCAMET